jgi:cation/acetate symporter
LHRDAPERFGGRPRPSTVAQVLAFAFGMAAASFFPIIVLGIFWKRCNAVGAASGMVVGLIFTITYMVYTLEVFGTSANDHIFDISPEGIGTIGALVNFVVTIVVSKLTPPPPKHLIEMIENIRYPAARRVKAGAVVEGERD